MSQNRNLDTALQYHSGTKHSYLGLRTHPHNLDWDNKPLLFKIYPTLEVTRLPRDFRETGMPALAAIAAPEPQGQTEAVPDLETLAQVLFFSAGVTRSKKHAQGETFFRAAACTGALYEIELYVVCTDIKGTHSPGLAAGVYHFGAAEFGLRQLRAGDFRQVLVDATGADFAVAHAPVTFLCTGTYWRNAWKYRSRTYRHFGWDNGTILANLLAISAGLKLPAKVFAGFIDSQLNSLLGVDPRREVTFSLVTLGYQPAAPPRAAEVSALELPTVPYSREEVEYPSMRKVHEASALDSREEVIAWRGKTPSPKFPASTGEERQLQLPDASRIAQDTIEQVIARRGSSRQFARDPITKAQ